MLRVCAVLGLGAVLVGCGAYPECTEQSDGSMSCFGDPIKPDLYRLIKEADSVSLSFDASDVSVSVNFKEAQSSASSVYHSTSGEVLLEDAPGSPGRDVEFRSFKGESLSAQALESLRELFLSIETQSCASNASVITLHVNHPVEGSRRFYSGGAGAITSAVPSTVTGVTTSATTSATTPPRPFDPLENLCIEETSARSVLVSLIRAQERLSHSSVKTVDPRLRSAIFIHQLTLPFVCPPGSSAAGRAIQTIASIRFSATPGGGAEVLKPADKCTSKLTHVPEEQLLVYVQEAEFASAVGLPQFTYQGWEYVREILECGRNPTIIASCSPRVL